MTIESKRLQFAILAILIFAFSFITFYHLGKKPLLDYDESIYAQVARQAFENKNQLGFTWYGNNGLYRTGFWFEKPPLMIWLTESAYFVFGINEFAARFWTAVFALLTFVLTFFFTKKISQSFTAAILAVSVFFIAFQFIYNAGVLQFDIPVGFFILLSLFSFWLGKEKSKFYFIFWLSLGLGVLTKSVIGLLPLPIIFVYSLLARDFFYLKSKNFYLGSLLFLVIALPWHIIESVRYGQNFWQQYLFYHLLQRYETGLEGNGQPFSFYWDIIFQHRLLFWSLILSLVYFAIKSFKSKNYLFVALTLLFIFLFFSTAKTKLLAYILVIYPYIAIIIGIAFADFSKILEKYRKHFGNLFILAIVLFFIFLGFKYNQYKLSKEKEQYLLDSKETGIFLKNNFLNENVYYYSITGTKPSTIFYSNRVVYFLKYPSEKPTAKFILVSEVKPNFPNTEILLSTPTQVIYQVH